MAKEVLMSRRNAPMDHVDATTFSRNSAGGAGSGLGSYQPPPISNYKGVMLCDRPVAKMPGKPQQLESGQAMPFSCSIGPMSKFEQIGLNPSREERAARLAMESKVAGKIHDDFFSKHKQWLAQLKKDRRRKLEEDQEELQRAEEKKRKFKEYSAKLRDSIRQAKAEEGGVLTQAALEQHQRESAEGVRAERDSKAATPQKSDRSKSSKGKRKEKPAWAMTEQQLERKEEEDVDDLINFASGLDFNKYINDWEVRSALAAVKDRINNLGTDQNAGADVLSLPDDEDWKKAFADEWNREEAEAIIAAAKSRGAKAKGDTRPGTAQSVRSDVSGTSVATSASRASNASRASRADAGLEAVDENIAGLVDPAYRAAERVLQSSRQLRKIHSSHSIRNILDKKKKGSHLETVGEDVGPVMPPPTMVTYGADDIGGPKGASKPGLDPSNLPYLHRNPAV
eukprot:CAMPEP_0114558176 /NCGR_PEP_ID=MMETSP0114-20121206/10232_1 /TAXON_ID=31324 /ORGANISM="Goniomonas sp, Strain m" /LENGTH=453 /DNA_ID=CAMNT_0001743529 /DNA_START=56 /DNA_END=1417 /DNA_ORIENTATION=+